MEQELDTYVKVRKDMFENIHNKNIELSQNLQQLKKELEEEKYLHQLDEKTEDLYRNLYLEERQKFYNLKEWLKRNQELLKPFEAEYATGKKTMIKEVLERLGE